jgi:hypothetical protein
MLTFLSLLLTLCSFDLDVGDRFTSSVASSREYKESDSESEYCNPCFSSACAIPETDSRSLTLYTLAGDSGSDETVFR